MPKSRMLSTLSRSLRNGLLKTHHNNGFTLVELLVVIAVLAILVTAVLPFGASIEDDTKRKKTVQVLESIRFGLIGAENAYDANGNRVIGGYIGDFGKLPDLITHYWHKDNKEWTIQYEKDGSDYLPYVYDTNLADSHSYLTDGTKKSALYTDVKENRDKFNQNAMPLALWTNYVKFVEGSDVAHQELVDKEDWEGPYVVRERDDFTNDDDLFTYHEVDSDESPADVLSVDEIDENRKFWLRQGKGRLLDGWGSALLFYMDDDDFYVVSAGSDRRINYGKYYLDDTEDYDNGPADLNLSGNEDNIVMVLTKEQWDLTNQKVNITRLMLQDLKTAIIGGHGNVTGGVKQPNGFVADIGGLETLVGSYVYEEGETNYVYQCIKRHKSSSSLGLPTASGGDNDYWEGKEVDDSTTTSYTETIKDDYPFATKWQDDRDYYEAQPQLVLMNADYVKVTDDDDVTYYRYVDDEDGTTSKPTATSTVWAEDDTFAGQEWVKEHSTSTTYTSEILNPWQYYTPVEFGAGWRGPYTSYTAGPLTDAWGREIKLAMDKGSLVLRSCGPKVYKDGSTTVLYEDDDLTETITQSDYSAPATVTVKPEQDPSDSSKYRVQMANNDYVTVYSAFNGGVGYFNALLGNPGTSTTPAPLGDLDGTFYFTRADGHKYGPDDVTADAANTSAPLEITDGLGASAQASETTNDEYKKGVWLPTGKVMVVYRSGRYKDKNTSSPKDYASPHPDNTLVEHTDTTPSTDDTTALTTSYKYQRTFLIHARTNPELVLGEE